MRILANLIKKHLNGELDLEKITKEVLVSKEFIEICKSI